MPEFEPKKQILIETTGAPGVTHKPNYDANGLPDSILIEVEGDESTGASFSQEIQDSSKALDALIAIKIHEMVDDLLLLPVGDHRRRFIDNPVSQIRINAVLQALNTAMENRFSKGNMNFYIALKTLSFQIKGNDISSRLILGHLEEQLHLAEVYR